ncbi:MAG: abortive infection family protein [Caulobacteraceae bacterium]|nr:abortive infection family protein [Caulobacteraceae bacterium]
MIAILRSSIADEIAKTKSYDVPGLCTRLGLAPGTGDEAHQSKARYASRRLAELPPPRLVEIARALLEEAENFDLEEQVGKIDDLSAPEVTEITRGRLMTLFDATPLATQQEEIDLIRKIWPISQMPAAVEPQWGQVATLEDDIFQHTIRNHDWSGKELLEKLGLPTCSTARLFRFLALTVAPVMRTPSEQAELAAEINAILVHDGYGLTVVARRSGSAIYEVQPLAPASPADDAISAALVAFNPTDVHPRWQAALESRETNPQRAITLARTLLEDVSKWILTQSGEAFDDGADLPVLYKKLAKTLNLAPDDHTEQLFKQILSGCQSVVTGLGALRNKLGDAHSIGPIRARPLPRHAELAVNLAGTMATFLIATWEARRAPAS